MFRCPLVHHDYSSFYVFAGFPKPYKLKIQLNFRLKTGSSLIMINVETNVDKKNETKYIPLFSALGMCHILIRNREFTNVPAALVFGAG